MTNHTFKVITQQARPYQGFPYVNPAYTDAPSVAPPPPPDRPARTVEPGPSRPIVLELSEIQTATSRPVVPKPISQAERELRERYGQSRATSEQVTSPYVDETIFYDPFENRRIAHPKDSPSPVIRTEPKFASPPRDQLQDEDSDDSDAFPTLDSGPDPHVPPPDMRYGSFGGPSRSVPGSSPMSPSGSSTPYFTKEAGLYGNSPANVLPTPMPMDQFPEPPPAYTEMDLARSASSAAPAAADTAVPPPTPVHARHDPAVHPAWSPAMHPTSAQSSPSVNPTPPTYSIITTPTPTVGQNPAELYNPSRKIVTCQFCRQNVLTIIKKENGLITHMCASLCCIFGCFPGTVCVYCTDHFKESRHYCPNCDLLVGKEIQYRSGQVEYREEPLP